jgi:hypothetical protein
MTIYHAMRDLRNVNEVMQTRRRERVSLLAVEKMLSDVDSSYSSHRRRSMQL